MKDVILMIPYRTGSLLAEAADVAVHQVVCALPLKEDGCLVVAGSDLAARSLGVGMVHSIQSWYNRARFNWKKIWLEIWLEN